MDYLHSKDGYPNHMLFDIFYYACVDRKNDYYSGLAYDCANLATRKMKGNIVIKIHPSIVNRISAHSFNVSGEVDDIYKKRSDISG